MPKIVKSISEGVQIMLDIWELDNVKPWKYIPMGENDMTDILELDGVKYPLFYWRRESNLLPVVEHGRNSDSCSAKLNNACERNYGLDRLMYKEFEKAQWMLDSDINHIMCFEKGNSANIIAGMENGKVALLELGATLPEGTVEQGRHSVWGQNGMASTRVVSQKDTPQAIYMYTDDPKPTTFNDDLIYLYGLSSAEVVKVTAIVEILSGHIDVLEWPKKDKQLRHYVQLAHASSATGVRKHVKEEK